MALFKKKPDAVSERAKALDNQIAALEAEIKKLSQQSQKPAAESKPGNGSGPHSNSSSPQNSPRGQTTDPTAPQASSSAIPNFGNPNRNAPRLRSTAHPHRPFAQGNDPLPEEPIFEEVHQPQIKADTDLPAPTPEDLGTRRSDFGALWRRVLRHFRGPVTSNPKLVNYLAAGSIQGLQPLRYEKRVARNRFIFFALFLALVLLGLIAMLRKP